MRRLIWTGLVACTLLLSARVGYAQDVLPVSHKFVRPGAACEAPCVPECVAACPTLVKGCVAVPSTKKISKVVYCSSLKEFCVPKCALGKKCDDSCGQGACENRVRTARVLMKKVVVTECPSYKCEPTLVEGRQRHGIFGHHHHGRGAVSSGVVSSGVVVTPAVETIPVAPKKN